MSNWTQQIRDNQNKIQQIIDSAVEITALPPIIGAMLLSDVMAFKRISGETFQMNFEDFASQIVNEIINNQVSLTTKAEFNTALTDGTFVFPDESNSFSQVQTFNTEGTTPLRIERTNPNVNIRFEANGIGRHLGIGSDGVLTWGLGNNSGLNDIILTQGNFIGGTDYQSPLTTRTEFESALTDAVFLFDGDDLPDHEHIISDITDFTDNSQQWDDFLLVTASIAELNLLDLGGLTAGWVLSADSATSASWKAPTATFSGTVTSDILAVGGGYGNTGATIGSNGDISTNGDLVVDGGITANGGSQVFDASNLNLSTVDFVAKDLTVSNEILIDIDRAWRFEQFSSGTTTELNLRTLTGGKSFRISNIDNTAQVKFTDGRIVASGSVTGTVFIPTSDRNLKENIVEITDPRKLDTKYNQYNLKSDEADENGNKRMHFGVMAQDLLEQGYERFVYARDVTTTDEEGEETTVVRYGVNMTELHSEEISFLKFNDNKKDELISSLEKRIESLEKTINNKTIK